MTTDNDLGSPELLFVISKGSHLGWNEHIGDINMGTTFIILTQVRFNHQGFQYILLRSDQIHTCCSLQKMKVIEIHII